MRTKDEIFKRVLTLRDALFPGRSGVEDCLGLATAGIITLQAEGIKAVKSMDGLIGPEIRFW